MPRLINRLDALKVKRAATAGYYADGAGLYLQVSTGGARSWIYRFTLNRFQEGCVEQNTNTGELVRRMLSDNAADKVIVCTIQKLGLALDENSKRNRSREKRGQATYTDQLEALRDKRMVFIFDECHRSQFGDKDATRQADGSHTGVYYNAYSEDLFVWDNDEDNDGADVRLTVLASSLSKFHTLLTEDTHAELVRIEGETTRATAKHNEFLKELGLPLLPSANLGAK